MAAQRFAPGALVFVPDEQDAYALRKVVTCAGVGAAEVVEVQSTGGGAKASFSGADLQQVVDADPLALAGAEDMVKFSALTEAALLYNLRVRYAQDKIYSSAGSILVSVNPFKALGIYTQQEMQRCKEADVKQLQELPPHVFVIAEMAFRGMLVEQKMQAILISGESGAGKTEAAKHCLRHIVSRSKAAAASSAPQASSGNAQFIEQCILQANPLLEAFGNAKTVRNSNSSRFGKWVEIQFDASGLIVSSRITSYLLEKSRVVEHAQGERTYHVLYQLCKGCSDEQRKELQLPPPPEIKYIGGSAQMQVAGLDDRMQWRSTCEAMDDFKISAEEQRFVRRVLAGLLHLGNLEFDPVQLSQQDDGSCVAKRCESSLRAVSEMFAVAPPSLEQALTVKSVGKFPVVQVPQPPAKAAAARDALAKAAYGNLFEWLLGRVNAMMGLNAAAGTDSKRKIGLLDIFGFEAFTRNSLEQLLINYANEKLQQFFNVYIFRLEEQECRSEGVACPPLDFADNAAVVSLIETKPTGLLSLINEEVLVPNSSDVNLLQKMLQNHRGHTACKAMPRSLGEGFTIVHFAGEVSYHIEGFVDKSRDALPSELNVVMATSTMPPLPALFKGSSGETNEGGGGSARGGGARARSGAASRRVVALGRQFQDSLDALLSMLDATAPHFIRTVKPNAALVSDQFDGAFVMRQLNQMGMVHVVRARKQGYAHRYSFSHFLSRYGYLKDGLELKPGDTSSLFEKHLGSASPAPGERTDCVALIAALVGSKQFERDGWAVGTGKIFMKAAQQQQLEVAREAFMRRVITEQLQRAVKEQDLELLDKAVAAAVEIRLQSPLVQEAQRLHALLKAQREAAQKLQEAIELRDVGRLESALRNAAQVKLSGELLDKGERLLAQLRAQHKASEALTAALHSNKSDALSAALEQAKQSGLNTALVQEAQRRLDTLLREREIEVALVEASRGSNLQQLVHLLAQAEEIGMATEGVRNAQRQKAQLKEAAQLQAQLQDALATRDADAVRELLQRASKLQCPPPDELRSELDKARSVLHSLEEAKAAAAAEAEQKKVVAAAHAQKQAAV